MTNIFWTVIALEAVVIVLVVIQMLRKRAANRGDEDSSDASIEQGGRQSKPIVELPDEERWD